MVGTTCYSFQASKLKIVGVLFFFDASYFRWRSSFFGLIHLWRPITPVQNLTRPISTTFLESSGRELWHDSTLDTCANPKISSNCLTAKKVFFLHFPKEIQGAANRTILTPADFPIGSLKAFMSQSFQNTCGSLSIYLFRTPGSFEGRWSWIVISKKTPHIL